MPAPPFPFPFPGRCAVLQGGEASSARERLWLLLEMPDSSNLAYMLYLFLNAVIILSLVNFVVATMQSVNVDA